MLCVRSPVGFLIREPFTIFFFYCESNGHVNDDVTSLPDFTSFAPLGIDCKITVAFFCLSVCLSALYGRKFYSILMKFCTEFSKNAFVRGQNPMTPSFFCPNFHPVMRFQWEHPNSEVTRPAVKSSIDVPYGAAICTKLQNAVTPSFAPKTKMGISAFSVGTCLAKCLTVIRDRVYGFEGPPIGNHILRVQWSREWWRHMWPQMVNVVTSESLRHHIVITVQLCKVDVLFKLTI